jgi:glutathione S-transferase
MVAVTDQVDALETQLREAVLAGDVKVLDALLADDLVFTDQAGRRLTKADDLAAHNAGRLKITQIDISDQHVRFDLWAERWRRREATGDMVLRGRAPSRRW